MIGFKPWTGVFAKKNSFAPNGRIGLATIRSMTDVTQILSRIEKGDPTGTSELLPLVYEELRALARQRLTHEKPGQTLQATALVHETYLRLVGGQNANTWESRAHFFGAAAEAMRRILVDQARRKGSQKRGGGIDRIDGLDELVIVGPEIDPIELLELDEALKEFEAIDPVRARVVKLHYLSGFTLAETADAMGVSTATVKRHWIFSRSWLARRMQTGHS
jgi:RNA polymerase sigma factor (TIGR02999 family)